MSAFAIFWFCIAVGVWNAGPDPKFAPWWYVLALAALVFALLEKAL